MTGMHEESGYSLFNKAQAQQLGNILLNPGIGKMCCRTGDEMGSINRELTATATGPAFTQSGPATPGVS